MSLGQSGLVNAHEGTSVTEGSMVGVREEQPGERDAAPVWLVTGRAACRARPRRAKDDLQGGCAPVV